MKKLNLLFCALLIVSVTFSCKDQKAENQDEMEQSASDANASTSGQNDMNSEKMDSNSNEKSNNMVMYTTDPAMAVLGKKQEAEIKVIDLKLIKLTDPDGADKGSELTYKVEVTNKEQIGGDRLYIETQDFRLELDNGKKIAPKSRGLSIEPEETATSDEDTFEIPQGAKPVAMHLFFNDTRAIVKLMNK